MVGGERQMLPPVGFSKLMVMTVLEKTKLFSLLKPPADAAPVFPTDDVTSMLHIKPITGLSDLCTARGG